MEDQQWEIQKYVLDNGVCPFDEWFNTFQKLWNTYQKEQGGRQ